MMKLDLSSYLLNCPNKPSNAKKEITMTMKICVVGDYGVGKSAIVERYIKDTFSSQYKISIGADFANKVINYDENTKLNVQLWDIAGSEWFGHFTSVYYKYAVGAIIVYDMSRFTTFQSVEKWLKDIRARTHLSCKKEIPIIIIGNKCDIVAKDIINDEKRKFCEEHNILDIVTTSAKMNINIRWAIEQLIKEILKNQLEK